MHVFTDPITYKQIIAFCSVVLFAVVFLFSCFFNFFSVVPSLLFDAALDVTLKYNI